jgi:hypothetical protein
MDAPSPAARPKGWHSDVALIAAVGTLAGMLVAFFLYMQLREFRRRAKSSAGRQ